MMVPLGRTLYKKEGHDVLHFSGSECNRLSVKITSSHTVYLTYREYERRVDKKVDPVRNISSYTLRHLHCWNVDRRSLLKEMYPLSVSRFTMATHPESCFCASLLENFCHRTRWGLSQHLTQTTRQYVILGGTHIRWWHCISTVVLYKTIKE